MKSTSLAQSCKTYFWLIALLLTLFSVVLEGRAVTCDSVIDDHGWLHDVAQAGCDKNLADCFKNPQLRYYYRPLVAASFVPGKLRYPVATGVEEARPYHIENLVHHGLAVLLLFWMFRLLFRRHLPAVLAGTLFALHPLNVPVTTFIGGRTDNLALIFLELFVIGLLKATELPERATNSALHEQTGNTAGNADVAASGPVKDMSASAEAQPSHTLSEISGADLNPVRFSLYILLSFVGFAGALFSKEQCVLLLLLVPMLDAYRLGMIGFEVLPFWRSFAGTVAGGWRYYLSAPWLAVYPTLILIYIGMARSVSLKMHQEDVATHAKTIRSFFAPVTWDFGLHVALVGRTCWYYFCAFAIPVVDRMHQSTLGPWDWKALGPLGRNAVGVPHPPSPMEALGGYLALALVLWLFWYLRKEVACRFCLYWLVLTLLPCLNLIPVPSQLVAPYRALIPLVGVCGVVGFLLATLLDRKLSTPVTVPIWALFGFVCGGCIYLTLQDVPQWKNDATLMQAELKADPNFVPARFGEAYLFDVDGDLKRAIDSYSQGLHQLLPEAETPEDCIRAGRAPDISHRLASASSLRYLDIPWLSGNFRIRGGLYQRWGHWYQAADDYKVVHALEPTDPSIGDWLAFALDHAGRWKEAEAVLLEQIQLRPDSYRLSQLGYLYYRQHRWVEARDTLDAALLAPTSDTGATADLTNARYQYEECVGRIKLLPSNRPLLQKQRSVAPGVHAPSSRGN